MKVNQDLGTWINLQINGLSIANLSKIHNEQRESKIRIIMKKIKELIIKEILLKNFAQNSLKICQHTDIGFG